MLYDIRTIIGGIFRTFPRMRAPETETFLTPSSVTLDFIALDLFGLKGSRQCV